MFILLSIGALKKTFEIQFFNGLKLKLLKYFTVCLGCSIIEVETSTV